MFFKKKVTLLLDIDGVFNSLGRIEDPIIVRHDLGIWQISEKNAEFLKYLAKRKDVKCIWSSTWGKESNQLNKFLGIKNFKCIFSGDKYFDIELYMRTHMKKRNILVIDDDYLDLYEYQYEVNGTTGLTEVDRQNILTCIDLIQKDEYYTVLE